MGLRCQSLTASCGHPDASPLAPGMRLGQGQTVGAARGRDAWEMLYLNDVFIRRPALHRLRHAHHRTIFLDTHNLDGNRNSLSSEDGRVQNLRVLTGEKRACQQASLPRERWHGRGGGSASCLLPRCLFCNGKHCLSHGPSHAQHSTAHQCFPIAAQPWLRLHGVGDCLVPELFSMLNTAFILVPN